MAILYPGSARQRRPLPVQPPQGQRTPGALSIALQRSFDSGVSIARPSGEFQRFQRNSPIRSYAPSGGGMVERVVTYPRRRNVRATTGLGAYRV